MIVIEKGVEISLDDPAMCAGDLGGGPMLMRDYSRERFHLEPLRRMIAKTIPKALTGRGQDQSQDRSNQLTD